MNAGNWRGVTLSSSTATIVNGAIAATTTFTTLHINVNAAASTVTFYVNGVSIGSSSTNIPTTAIGPLMVIQKLLGTTNRVLNADLFYLYQNLTSAR